jgi:hypothetical protein
MEKSPGVVMRTPGKTQRQRPAFQRIRGAK